MTACCRRHDDPGTPDDGVGAKPIIDMGAYEFGTSGTPPAGPCPGDLDGDGLCTAEDIDAFVAALVKPDQFDTLYPDSDMMSADVNQDGVVNFADINPFIELLGV